MTRDHMSELIANIQKKMDRGMPGTVTPEEIDYLLALIRERDAEIARLKTACNAYSEQELLDGDLRLQVAKLTAERDKYYNDALCHRVMVQDLKEERDDVLAELHKGYKDWDLQKSFVYFRQKLRSLLHEHGVPSNPGFTEDCIVAGFEQAFKIERDAAVVQGLQIARGVVGQWHTCVDSIDREIAKRKGVPA